MGALHVDFTIPIALLAAAIVGVMVVRQITRFAARRAKRRTEQLIARHAPPGIDTPERASKEA